VNTTTYEVFIIGNN